MKFIEALKLKSKLFLLFIFITIGLIMLGLMGTVYIKSMKKSIDNLYFGSLIPVSELNYILQTYNANLASNIYKAKFEQISNYELQQDILDDLKQIDKKWSSYSSHYKTKEELPYINYATNEIKKTNHYFYRIYLASKSNKDLTKLSVTLLDKEIKHINKVIKKLLNYELNSARYNRKLFLKDYDKTFKTVIFILFIIIFSVLVVTYMVFKSIQKEHTKLKVATDKLKKANKKLQNASYTDTLTGLNNRRYFNLVYDREVKRAKRDKKYITFMMIDIDYFKQYNDTYGHIAGDHTLQIVAKVIKSTFKRPGDFVFRLGGEEFGVLIIDTDELNSARLAKMLNLNVKAQAIEHKASKVADVVTVSIGVACCIADSSLDEEELIKKADDMLYEAKENGRNRYHITSEIYIQHEAIDAA